MDNKKLARVGWRFLGLFFMAGLLCACEEVLLPVATGERTVKITTDPPGCRIVLESMGNRQVLTYYSPVEISYAPKPGLPSKISVSKDGYQTKNIRLDGSQNHLHIVLEKVSTATNAPHVGGAMGSNLPGGEMGGAGGGPPSSFGGSQDAPAPGENFNPFNQNQNPNLGQ